MAISNELLEFAIDLLAGIDETSMDASRMVDDVVLMAYIFDDPKRFTKAIANVRNAIYMKCIGWHNLDVDFRVIKMIVSSRYSSPYIKQTLPP